MGGGETMDRGSDALKSHMNGCEEVIMKQTRKGWFQEILGCEASTEFKYYKGETQFATSLEDADCFCRICCPVIHPFNMSVKELNTQNELVHVERPLRCANGGCKCCCYQEAFFTSNNNKLGRIEEQCYFCVPSYRIYDHNDNPIYYMHQPTCCGGMCVNICAEGNPCGKGCCKESFRIYDAAQEGNTGGDAPYLGQIMKREKSLSVAIFTDADTFEVKFPKDATADQKGILVGTSIFINAVFFEGEDDQAVGG